MRNFPDENSSSLMGESTQKRWKPSLSKTLFFTEKIENKTSSLIHYSVDLNIFFCQILRNSGWNFHGTLTNSNFNLFYVSTPSLQLSD